MRTDRDVHPQTHAARPCNLYFLGRTTMHHPGNQGDSIIYNACAGSRARVIRTPA